MVDVVSVGELIVEIMRPKVDAPFSEVGDFIGPFPSGAPAIVVDAVSNLGTDAGIVGTVGNDEFGDVLKSRLEHDGVELANVETSNTETTGVAFASYCSGGHRQFIYHVANAAAGLVGPEDISRSLISEARAFHVSGSTVLINKGLREACYEGVKIAEKNGTLVSFDPNIRSELLGDGYSSVFDPILSRADILTPTAEELTAFSDTGEEQNTIDDLLTNGASLVAVTKGADGCTLYTEDAVVDHSGFDFSVMDPTGAGDAFSAAMLVGTLEKMSLEQRAAFANAVGGFAVSKCGPMEGIPDRKQVNRFVHQNSGSQ